MVVKHLARVRKLRSDSQGVEIEFQKRISIRTEVQGQTQKEKAGASDMSFPPDFYYLVYVVLHHVWCPVV